MLIRICDVCKKNGKVVELKPDGGNDNPRLVESGQYSNNTVFWDFCEVCIKQIKELIGPGTKISQGR